MSLCPAKFVSLEPFHVFLLLNHKLYYRSIRLYVIQEKKKTDQTESCKEVQSIVKFHNNILRFVRLMEHHLVHDLKTETVWYS